MQQRFRDAILAGAVAQTAPFLASALCDALAKPASVLVRIWLVDGEDELCLVASAGSPLGGGSYRRTDGSFSRFQFGVGKIGTVAATRMPFITRKIRGDEDWLANPGWIARQQVRSCMAYPLVAGEEALGVLAVFDRTPATDEMLDGLSFLADYAAVRLASLRASAAPAAPAVPVTPATPAAPAAPAGPLTRRALRDLEQQSIAAALAATNGRVFGPGGAAALLEMKPTTLASRIRALGLK